MDNENPHEELGESRSLTNTVVPLRKSAPASIKKLILELGLRYHPTSPEALEPFKAKLAALMADCANVPPAYLDRAIKRWVTESKWMPTAADLIGLARTFMADAGRSSGVDRDSRENAELLAQRYNARLRTEGKLHIRWVVAEQNQLKLEKVA